MPSYDYLCNKCNVVYEVRHEMSCKDKYECSKCHSTLEKQISSTFYVTGGMKSTLEDIREENHKKKTKDMERAIRSRKRAFGHDAVGDPVDQPDPKHLVRGKVIGGQEMELDKNSVVKALAKDDFAVATAQKAIKKAQNK